MLGYGRRKIVSVFGRQTLTVFDVMRELMAPPEPNKRKIWVSGEGTSSTVRKDIKLSFRRFENSKERGKNRARVRVRSLGGNRNEKRRGPGRIQAGASVSAQNLLDDARTRSRATNTALDISLVRSETYR